MMFDTEHAGWRNPRLQVSTVKAKEPRPSGGSTGLSQLADDVVDRSPGHQ